MDAVITLFIVSIGAITLAWFFVIEPIINAITWLFEPRKTPSKTITKSKTVTEPEPVYEEPETVYEDGYPIINGAKSSRPQKALFELLYNKKTEIKGHKQYNTRIGYRYADMIYHFCGDKIAVEYDGKHYHKKEDHKRDNELISHGYKVLHFVSDIDITKEMFTFALFRLVFSKRNVYYHYQN